LGFRKLNGETIEDVTEESRGGL